MWKSNSKANRIHLSGKTKLLFIRQMNYQSEGIQVHLIIKRTQQNPHKDRNIF